MHSTLNPGQWGACALSPPPCRRPVAAPCRRPVAKMAPCRLRPYAPCRFLHFSWAQYLWVNDAGFEGCFFGAAMPLESEPFQTPRRPIDLAVIWNVEFLLAPCRRPYAPQEPCRLTSPVAALSPDSDRPVAPCRRPYAHCRALSPHGALSPALSPRPVAPCRRNSALSPIWGFTISIAA